MKKLSLLYFFSLVARTIGIWYVPADMPPPFVTMAAIKKWGSPGAALTHFLQSKSLKLSELYASCLLWRAISSSNPLAKPHVLGNILMQIPPKSRETAFLLLSQGDLAYAAGILIQLAPCKLSDLAPVAISILSDWNNEPRSDNLALNFYQALGAYGFSQYEILWLLVRALFERNLHIQAEPLLLQLAQLQPTSEVWWCFVLLFHVLRRHPRQRLESLYRFIASAPADPRTCQAWQMIGNLFDETLENNSGSQMTAEFLQAVRSLLDMFPAQSRAEILALAMNNDDTRIARLLSMFTVPAPLGLEHLAQAILSRWKQVQRSDEQALEFYRAVTMYDVSREESESILARTYIARGQYDRAEPLLCYLAQTCPSPDILWLLASTYRTLSRPPQLVLKTLSAFIELAPTDGRTGQAWYMIGNFYAEPLHDGMAAVDAYQRAEMLGVEIPQLLAFRIGNWNAIPALRAHPDYPFPVIVAVDLEVDPQPGAKAGERVYEIAAVRTKGKTTLRVYQSFIRRPFHPAKMISTDVLLHAPEPEQVAAELRAIIGKSLVVGHNLQAFDAEHLRNMSVPISNDCLLDTLTFARLLYPDSIHHNLALLCHEHNITLSSGEWHSALPDARACAELFYALGEELVRRGGALLTGFRSLVPPGSAFDRAVLQPRNIFADPHLSWSLDPAPSEIHVPAVAHSLPGSASMRQALQDKEDTLIELYDPEAAYAEYLPHHLRTVVTAQTRTRLEFMLATCRHRKDMYVLPDPDTLLCPHRLRTLIEQAADSDYKLLLFCLYQASHNKDARTLYPMRLPSDEADFVQLRRDLFWACCASDPETSHLDHCSAHHACIAATSSFSLIFATHEALVHQKTSLEARNIVVDDVAELQMHLAEYMAKQIKSDRIYAWTLTQKEQEAMTLLYGQIQKCAQEYIAHPGYHERLSLRSIIRYLTQPVAPNSVSVLSRLDQSGSAGKRLATDIRELCTKATLDAEADSVHAYWLDLWFADTSETKTVERWALCGLSENVQHSFQRIFWGHYDQHILCGVALTTNNRDAQFLERSLGIPQGLRLRRDKRPRSRVSIPTREMLPTGGFLQRKTWMWRVAKLLFLLQAHKSERSVLIALNHTPISRALACAFREVRPMLERQMLASGSGWTISKIAQRLADPERSVLVITSPEVRRSHLSEPVDIEATGPLRFLNQQDPVVAANMRVFAHRYKAEGPFNAYLLPQALLELKTRLSSQAKLHVILDSRLHTRSYRDEVFEMLEGLAAVEPFSPLMDDENAAPALLDDFLAGFSQALNQQGFDSRDEVSDEDLQRMLRAFWDTDHFRQFHTDDDTRPSVSQKDIVRQVLNKHDQLLVASTGGGKSLCFQLPALILAEEEPPKVTLVFSPLISLMSNQVEDLRRKGIFSAIVLNSTLPTIQRQEHLRGLKRGDYSIVYIAPEQIRSSGLRRALEGREIGLIVIDEAHCLSQWGHDFRTEYFAIKDWIGRMWDGERQFPILALTATARKGYKDAQDEKLSDRTSTICDIIGKLHLKIGEQDAIITSPQRKELAFYVEQIIPPSRICKCGGTLQLQANKVTCQQCGYAHHLGNTEVEKLIDTAKIQRLLELLNEPEPSGLRSRWKRPEGERQRGLIYCAYKKTTDLVAEELRKRIPEMRIATYHADLTSEVREDVLQRFTRDGENGLDIVVATNAFGMGIDVRRLGFVIHYDIPGTLEAYYQEAGRAGRDELFSPVTEPALCILLYHSSDLQKQRYLSRKNIVTRQQIEDVYDVLDELRRDVVGRSEKQETDEYYEQEIIVAEQDIAARAGVSTDVVQMILHYLEYHSTLNDRPVLTQGETAHNVLRIKFEKGYQKQGAPLPQTSRSHPLLTCFRASDEFGLNEDTITPVPLRELARNLNWSMSELEREILNLVQRHIIMYECDGQIKWTKDAVYAKTVLTKIQQQVQKLLAEIDRKEEGRLLRGETIYVDLMKLDTTQKLTAIPFLSLLHFLAALSHGYGLKDEFRLLKRFSRSIRFSQPGKFEICLWTDDNSDFSAKLDRIFAALQEAQSLLEQLQVGDEEQVLDLLKIESHYQRRQRLHRALVLLDILGLVKYVGDPSLGLALRVTFKQAYAEREQLAIDLASLRLKETYAKNKLKLMERYATETQQSTRTGVFTSYFYGQSPIIERADQNIRSDLTPEQQSLFHLDKGYHLIEGPAGCGKTTALVEYVKHLVYEKRVPIERIMISTHFNSATNRIAKALEALQEDSSAALATTVNKFGEKIFRQYRLLFRRGDGKPYYENDPLPVRSEESTLQQDLGLISKALTIIYQGNWQGEPWPHDLERPPIAEPYQRDDGFERHCLEIVKRLRNQGVFPAFSLTQETLLPFLNKSEQNNLSVYYAVYVLFMELRGKANYYVFDDQILFALAILEANPDIAREYQHFFEHVIIDELQDFTPAQAKLLLIICTLQPSVLAFGDRGQEIRVKGTGADSVFKTFMNLDTCDSKPHSLTTHFRSTQSILEVMQCLRRSQSPETQPPLKSVHPERGELPVFLQIGSHNAVEGGMGIGMPPVEMMAQAALDRMKQIPEEERGSVALIVAKKDWVDQVVAYLRQQRYDFSVMNNTSLYQLHHVERILAYFHLINDPQSDADAERLLRSCVVPYFDGQQMKKLKDIARKYQRPLLALLQDNRMLRMIHMAQEQEAALQAHLAIFATFNSASLVREVVKAIEAIDNGPFSAIQSEDQKREDITSALQKLNSMTIIDALAEIQQHISFLEDGQKHSGLIVATVDHAKSEEFDTVFYLGAGFLQNTYPNTIQSARRRMYVAVSRARRRLFIVIRAGQAMNHPILSSIPEQFYKREDWFREANTKDA